MKQQSKLGRTGSHRKAMFRSLVTALFRNDRIRTTQIKAREVRPIAEKLITLAKRGDLHARRQAAGWLLDAEVLQKLFSDIGPRYQDRQGGYTRIVKLGQRRGDAAPEALLELV
ncbi:MAG: 50S ribosomal protein L17 [Firmicutes bacterium]|nr:50S ribosomal protein L17 [Bacillota bacterium]